MFCFGDLTWLEIDFRHIPRTNDALYGVLWKPSSGSAVIIPCWIIPSSILLTLGRSDERARMSRRWLACMKCKVQLREMSHISHTTTVTYVLFGTLPISCQKPLSDPPLGSLLPNRINGSQLLIFNQPSKKPQHLRRGNFEGTMSMF